MISQSTAASIRRALKPTFKERLDDNLAAGQKTTRVLVYLFIFLIGVIFGGLLIALIIGMNALALSYLWNLFVAPTFGLRVLTFKVSIGLVLFVNFVKAKVEDDKKKKDEEAKKTRKEILLDLSKSIIMPLIFIVFGWIVHHLI